MSPAPATSGTFADTLYRLLQPLADLDGGDEGRGWAMLHLCSAIGQPFQSIADVVYDREGGELYWAEDQFPTAETLVFDVTMPGWAILMDVDLCPTWALGWLAQFRGVRLVPRLATETEDAYWLAMRDRIKRADGQNRGSVDAIRAAAQRFLTGTKYMAFNERQGGAYRLMIRTFTTETPDSTAVQNAILEQKPAGIVLDYAAVAPTATYDLILANFDTYAALPGFYTDYADMATRVP